MALSIVVKSSHFSFLAKKRGKLQIPREECEEIAKEKSPNEFALKPGSE